MENRQNWQLSASPSPRSPNLGVEEILVSGIPVVWRKSVRARLQRGEIGSCSEGYDEVGPTAERLAAARYLLELNCQMPILVRSWTASHK
jgi:hypothetical protein